MNRGRSDGVATASLRLTRFTTEAIRRSTVSSRQSEVLLHRTVFQACWHPGLDVSVELASVDATVLAFLPAYNLPGRFERVWSNPASVEWHLGSVDRSIDNVEVGVSKSEAAGINLVEFLEDHELKLGW